MGKEFIEGLISAKLKSPRNSCLLVTEIRQTLQTTRTLPELEGSYSFSQALVHLAAFYLPVPEVVRRLSQESDWISAHTDPLNNALAAALYTGDITAVEVLLNRGVRPSATTYSFGDPVAIAACHAGYPCLRLLVDKALSQGDEYNHTLFASRLHKALAQAAAYSQADVFQKGIREVLTAIAVHEPLHAIIASCLSSALLVGHTAVVEALTKILQQNMICLLDHADDPCWLEILRLASSHGQEDVLMLILDSLQALHSPRNMEILLEDASRAGHSSIIYLLARRYPVTMDALATSAVFWAARQQHWRAFSALLTLDRCDDLATLATALCGASIHGPDVLSKVLRIFKSWHDPCWIYDSAGGRFEDMIDNLVHQRLQCTLYPDVPRRVYPEPPLSFDMSGGGNNGVTPSCILLKSACSIGNIVAVRDTLATMSSHEILRISASCFSTAIREVHPATLLYLCRRLPERRYFHTETALHDRSTAIIQILLDEDWDINTAPLRIVPPPLA